MRHWSLRFKMIGLVVGLVAGGSLAASAIYQWLAFRALRDDVRSRAATVASDIAFGITTAQELTDRELLALAAAFAFVGTALAAQMEGKIQSIDTASKEVVLDDGTKLLCDDSTNIMVEGKEGKLEDLKEGAQVKASYEEKDGKNVAAKLEVGE